MDHIIISECERIHYFMQLASYFSELADYPNVSFAHTNLVTDTWYNQAYNIHNTCNNNSQDTCRTVLENATKYFADRNRDICFYLTPATSLDGFTSYLEEQGFIPFDEEAWMFYDYDKDTLRDYRSDIIIKTVKEEDLVVFSDVYKSSLPGPEVDKYIQCVVNGFFARTPLVDIKYYLAYINDKAVGMLSYLSMGKYAGMYAIAVEQEFQKKGVCKSLVNHAVDFSKKNGVEYLFLQTGNGEDSQTAFKHMGFVTEFIRTGYVSKDSVEDIQHG